MDGSRCTGVLRPAGAVQQPGTVALAIAVQLLLQHSNVDMRLGPLRWVFEVDIPTAILLSVVAAICACGASGVAGGSLLLISSATSMRPR